MFKALDISTTGLTAQRIRMDVLAGNIANANVTEDASGAPNPYRRRFAVFQSGSRLGEDVGVQVARIEEDPTVRYQYDPGHRNAIPSGPRAGFVRYPNIDLGIEYINAIEASRAYEANLAVFDLSKNMISSSLRLLA